MINKVAVIGLGRFGASVARTLHQQGSDVLVLDRNRDRVDELKDEVTLAAACDATERKNLERFDVGNMDVVIVAIGHDFEASVHVTLQCRELGVPKIICKALTTRQKQVLELVGASQVVLPEERMGHWVAENIAHESVVNLVELPEGYVLARVPVIEEWCGRTLEELKLLSKERLCLVQVHRTRDDVLERIPLPGGQFQLEAGDDLDVIGPEKAVESIRPR
jgi:trk/ktr system potassium uptake protein